MGTNVKLYAALAIIFTSTVYGTCGKDIIGCADSSYSFAVDAKVYPDKDSINIGDTIWVEINTSTNLVDQDSKTIDFSHANNLATNMGFVKLANVSPIQLDDAVNDFTYVVTSGTEIPSANSKLLKLFLLKESGGRYLFQLGIIPKVSGTFRFNLGNADGVYRNGNSCPKAAFNYQLFNTTNQHYYLYPGGSSVTPAGADYYFYVR